MRRLEGLLVLSPVPGRGSSGCSSKQNSPLDDWTLPIRGPGMTARGRCPRRQRLRGRAGVRGAVRPRGLMLLVSGRFEVICRPVHAAQGQRRAWCAVEDGALRRGEWGGAVPEVHGCR